MADLSVKPSDGTLLGELKAALRRFRLYRGLSFARLLATDRIFRSDQLRRLRPPANMFQYRSLTQPNRYPRIFSFVRDRLAPLPQPRLLSFGCSTGEEVFSLRMYFPRATIKGIDIAATNIAACRRKLAATGDPGIEFAWAESAAGEPPESYDAIFCLAVFQHQALQDPKILTCERYLRFEAFEATVAGLARCLKPGGLLAIRHLDFRFSDTACRADFDAILRLEPASPARPRFDRHHRRLPDEGDTDVVFQKR